MTKYQTTCNKKKLEKLSLLKHFLKLQTQNNNKTIDQHFAILK